MEPSDGKGYDLDPPLDCEACRGLSEGIRRGDTAYFGPEPEFFIFDGVTWNVDMSGCGVKIKSRKAAGPPASITKAATWPTAGRQGWYFPVPPVDSYQDIRSEMCLILEQMGVPVEVHHHEVAGAGQCEIGTRFSTLTQRADWTQILKYVVMNVAASYGKTATFMPKPVVGDNGSGMHVHQSIWKGGENLLRAMATRVCRSSHSLHRRHHQACACTQRDHQSRHQLVQASGAGLRGTCQAGLLVA